jgi:hypothetical protein
MSLASTFANPFAFSLADDPYQTRAERDDPQSRTPPLARLSECARCGAKLLSAEQAATIIQSTRRQIYRWVEQGALHFHEAADGSVLICSHSLLEQVEQLERATARL